MNDHNVFDYVKYSDRVFCGVEQIPTRYRHAAVTIGNFDGVHRGHLRLIERLLQCRQTLQNEMACRNQVSPPNENESRDEISALDATLAKDAIPAEMTIPTLAITFDPHPGALLAHRRPTSALTTLRQKIGLLLQAGVDGIVILHTTSELLALSPEAFFEQILVRGLHATAVVEGADFRFGAARSGSVQTLQSLCDAHAMRFEAVPPLLVDEMGTEPCRHPHASLSFSNGQANSPCHPVSSSRIRGLLRTGYVAAAARLLGRPYTIRGTVVNGEHRGRTLGYPTANLESIETLLPPDALYAAQVPYAGKIYAAAVALGPNMTFGGATRKCEVHLLDFQGDLYGQSLTVLLLDRVRELKKFVSTELLLEQMGQDMQHIRKLADANSPTPTRHAASGRSEILNGFDE
ncbi:MAG: bifunctional riboflavin kinase/FMN adenylyltransferase [Thermoguttaceae bacterium]|nr:bifunctional riboflavin kinase/FMN adenylyltransferase [Thermoguttaceae bacterium]